MDSYEEFREILAEKYGVVGLDLNGLYNLIIDCKNFKVRELQARVTAERNRTIRRLFVHLTQDSPERTRMNVDSALKYLANEYHLSQGSLMEIIYAKRKEA